MIVQHSPLEHTISAFSEPTIVAEDRPIGSLTSRIFKISDGKERPVLS